MTTSGGGMVLTDDQALADHVRFLSTQAREPAVHYEHKEIGYNYRLSNLLAGLGRAQLLRLDDMIAKRRAHRQMYADLFADVDGVEIFQRDGDEHDNCWLTAIVVDSDVAGWDSRRPVGPPGRERHREPAALEAHAPPAGVRWLSAPGQRQFRSLVQAWNLSA